MFKVQAQPLEVQAQPLKVQAQPLQLQAQRRLPQLSTPRLKLRLKPLTSAKGVWSQKKAEKVAQSVSGQSGWSGCAMDGANLDGQSV